MFSCWNMIPHSHLFPSPTMSQHKLLDLITQSIDFTYLMINHSPFGDCTHSITKSWAIQLYVSITNQRLTTIQQPSKSPLIPHNSPLKPPGLSQALPFLATDNLPTVNVCARDNRETMGHSADARPHALAQGEAPPTDYEKFELDVDYELPKGYQLTKLTSY